ncbi:MAG: translation initiation factor [Candidatus Marinimicrobia bacterium]|nr:translation initiation factor [Candidatus Neomarinimicrobiota bacterium]
MKNNNADIVYSTDPDYQHDLKNEETRLTLTPDRQNLKLSLDRKARKGKEVTLIQGFTASEKDLKELGKELKKICGVGGTVKNGEILIQGNFSDKLFGHLTALGYKVKKIGG